MFRRSIPQGEVSVLIGDLDRGGDDDDSGDDGNGADGSGGGRKTGGKTGSGAKAGTREASGVPDVVEPETTAPYRIPRKPAYDGPVAPSRSGGIVLDIPRMP